MKTKSLIFTFSMIMLVMVSKAQEPASATGGGTTFGIRAGVNFQNLNGKDGAGDKLDNKMIPGFNAGVNVEIPVAPDYYLQPGVLFSTKGAKSGTTKVSISYIEIPINFLYKPLLGANRILLGFGPYAAFAIGGKVKPDGGSDMDIKFKSSVTTAEAVSGQPYLKRFDAGANLLAGYELSSSLSFQLNAQLGLLNINPKYEGASSDKSTLKNTGFGLSLGYRF